MGLWSQLKGNEQISSTRLKAWRIVEDQSKSTTRKYVSSSVEHDLLEKLIEQSKPTVKYYGDEQYFNGLHYLLFTPFRYPPLPWGSRFGTKFERGIFYASKEIETAMGEKAFYKLAFLRASEGNLGGKTISYTAFNVTISSDAFVDLCMRPFNEHEETISSKINYNLSKELGKAMRDDKVESIKYKSARKSQGTNIGIFSPKALINNNELDSTFKHLNCYSTKDIVEFSSKHQVSDQKTVFPVEMFLVNGVLPFPPS